MLLKKDLREFLKKKRLSLSSLRRVEARESAFKELNSHLKLFKTILSFFSLPKEIDLYPLNKQLAKEGRLALLLSEKNEEVAPYLVHDLKKDLEINAKTGVSEPLKARCSKLSLDQLGVVLVPGLGFDRRHHRLGYGIGCYDRLLKQVGCPTYGIGFKEQFLTDGIPIEKHDVALKEVFLF